MRQPSGRSLRGRAGTDMTAVPPRWDIFCTVVDNFGDAGVAWRLARMLAAEHGLEVTLWLDRPEALARIEPRVATGPATQHAAGVTVRRWTDPLPDAAAADVIVEAFGSGLPEGYLHAMAARARPPRWFVLEYLSAEPWVDGAHGLASPHPRLPLARRFWFPGFTAASGGLLRERGLLGERDAFVRDASAQAALWASLHVPVPAPDEVRVSIFCYPGAPLPALLDTWADGAQAVVCLVPDGVATAALERWSGAPAPRPGAAPLVRGPLSVHVIPFVAQDVYDRLLWACDVNFVRGEDSLVRAQWAARPCVWQPYAQEGGAHLAKLAAFADRYTAGLAPPVGLAIRRFWQAWNRHPEAPPIGAAWLEFERARPDLLQHGPAWAAQLAALPELAAALVRAARNGV
jgi:uncharacterized repeat protein (TIGR03837 family)